MKHSDHNVFEPAEPFAAFARGLAFLKDEWGFQEDETRNENFGCYFRYKNGGLTLRFGFDFREDFYYFDLQTGGNSMPLLHFFASQADEGSGRLDTELFDPNKVGWEAALGQYIACLHRYRREIMRLTTEDN